MPSAFSGCLRIRYDVNLADNGSGARFTKNLTTSRHSLTSNIEIRLRFVVRFFVKRADVFRPN